MSVKAEVIRVEPHVTVGSIIERDADKIIQRWSRRALEEQPGAQRVHLEALLDDLPELLRALGQSLAASDRHGSRAHKRPGRRHGQQRWQTGWSLAEVMQDYQILRLVLVQYLEETADRALTSRETMAIGLALDDAASASVTGYVRENEERVKAADQALRGQADLLKEANRRKDEFLAVLGHELRNPLAAIRNAVEVLALQGTETAKVEWVRGLLARQVQHMTRMVNDLLDVSRIAGGKVTLESSRIDFVALARQAVDDFSAAAEEAGLTLMRELPSAPVWVQGDGTRLTQVVNNLLHNAIKFTPRGGQVVVKMTGDGSQVILTVRDTGIGIDAHQLAHVFETFMQADRSLERNRGGLGLGLALVKGMVQLHGGEVQATSAGVNQGAEFRITLPTNQAEPADASPPAPALANQPAHARRLRLLIVEDNDDSALSLKMLLELAGHEALVASSGQDALALARTHRPDVLLCDLGLPGMSGYDVAEELRRDPAVAHIVMVAISGHGSPDDQERSRQVGFVRHMTKPIDPAILATFLAELPKPI